ncbi:alpha-L-fucosidase [Chitinimonas koreensis]|uniref:alpha-L-fucosidase n=1 Tax=Chitinimonas koreensis TaxID=356302 RepID=UPI0004200332|nr:alpha-L-fucosidase [Chitinimonas koreensis]QNM98789.1 alpha-L-fucosidase [Chitinimonas koreensis]
MTPADRPAHRLKRLLALAPLCLALAQALPAASAQAAAAPNRPPLADPLNRNADYQWFLDDRFGMFIHFGLYSNGARHEWMKHREKLGNEQYQKYFDTFDPDLFDARAWARAAKAAGMKYVVLTAKHHEGFALWDSKLTDYKITNTPFRRDLIREYVDALRAEGLKVGFYYSLIDWHHPDYPIDIMHPLRDDEAARKANGQRDIRKYAAYLHGQVRELLSNYGKIDYLWFDFSFPKRDGDWDNGRGKGRDDWQSEKLVELVHKLQPGIILNNRLDIPGGVDTPEQYQPKFGGIPGELKLVEECTTFSGSWGYYRDEASWKSNEQVVRLLVDAVSKGHNLLLNVGPNARGEFDARAKERLAALGEWTRLNGRSIYGAGPSAYAAPDGARYTQRGDRLYLHLENYPIGSIELDGLAGKVRYAQFLHDGSEIQFKEAEKQVEGNNLTSNLAEGSIRLTLPQVKPAVAVPVVELWLK